MDKFQAMKVFSRVVEAESFKAASDSLLISPPMVTRYINSLEAELGVKLLLRNTRNVSVTYAGKQYYQHCQAILDAIEEAEMALSELIQQPKGTLKISVPMDFGQSHLTPLLQRFCELYPDIRLELDYNDKRVDLTESGFDVAIRGGTLGGDQFVARPLGEINGYVCASPKYLARHGKPKGPEELSDHNCLVYTNTVAAETWRFHRQGEEFKVNVSGSVIANSGSALVHLARAGVGLIYQPDFLVLPHLESGELVQLLEDYSGYIGQFHAVYPQHKLLPRKTRLLLDFLESNLSLPIEGATR